MTNQKSEIGTPTPIVNWELVAKAQIGLNAERSEERAKLMELLRAAVQLELACVRDDPGLHGYVQRVIDAAKVCSSIKREALYEPS